MENEYKVTRKEKVLVCGIGTLVCLITLVIAAGFVNYQATIKLNKEKANQLYKTQISNVDKIKNTLPLFIKTDYYIKIKNMSIVKISQSALPATIQVGLDPGVSPNPNCGINITGSWDVYLAPSPASAVAVYDTRYPMVGREDGWNVTEGGVISVPSGQDIGTYTITYYSGDSCGNGNMLFYSYTLKITPPCPVLTITKG